MTLEASATYIDGLVITYPEGTANRSTADDHLRLIKSSLKTTFPKLDSAVTATAAITNRLNNRAYASYRLGAAGLICATTYGGSTYASIAATGSFSTVTSSNVTVDTANCAFTPTISGSYYFEWNLILSVSATTQYDFYTVNAGTSAVIQGPWRFRQSNTGSTYRWNHRIAHVYGMNANNTISIRVGDAAGGNALRLWGGSMLAYRMI